MLPIKCVASLRSGETLAAEDIADAGRYPVYGGNGLRGYTDNFTHEGTYPLIGRQGALCGNINYAAGRFWASEHAVVVSVFKGSDPLWLGEVLRAMNLNQYSVSAAQPGLSVESVAALHIPVPPIPEQKAISLYLVRECAKIDSLVAEQERLIGLLTEKRQAIISRAATKGLDPHVPMKPSCIEWLGIVPAHWELWRLGHLFRECSESGNADLPILSVSIHSGVSDKELNESEMERKVTRSDDKEKYKAVRPGDLTYNMMRAWQGAFGAVSVRGQVSPAYVVARPRREFRTAFVEQLLRTPGAVEEMRRLSRGITDFRLRLYWDEFATIRIALPPLAEQDSILASITRETARLDALSHEVGKAVGLLKERRASLISAAVTGQIDVRGYKPNIPTPFAAPRSQPSVELSAP